MVLLSHTTIPGEGSLDPGRQVPLPNGSFQSFSTWTWHVDPETILADTAPQRCITLLKRCFVGCPFQVACSMQKLYGSHPRLNARDEVIPSIFGPREATEWMLWSTLVMPLKAQCSRGVLQWRLRRPSHLTAKVVGSPRASHLPIRALLVTQTCEC